MKNKTKAVFITHYCDKNFVNFSKLISFCRIIIQWLRCSNQFNRQVFESSCCHDINVLIKINKSVT